MYKLILTLVLLPAAFFAGPQPGFGQSQGAFCIDSPTGRDCLYETLGACQMARGSRSGPGECIRNPAALDATGRGGMDAPRGSGPNSTDRMPLGGDDQQWRR
jgi:hypothetical protein